MEGLPYCNLYRSKFATKKVWRPKVGPPRIQPNRNFVFSGTGFEPVTKQVTVDTYTTRLPRHNFPSQRLVETSLAHWPGKTPAIGRASPPIDPRSHDDPE
ncbi:hypothetical protein TNCV_4627251 [Trichonephila clavipes]|nr:hypothetical protein TNCV_4627251 [Trichonephila clavipes]